MPYVICDACELVTYSAALWASTDECPRCGMSLPSARATRDDLAALFGNRDAAADGIRGPRRG